LMRHLLFFGGACHGLSWVASVGVFMAYNAVASAYIFSQFAMSHTHLPVSEADEYLHWVRVTAAFVCIVPLAQYTLLSIRTTL